MDTLVIGLDGLHPTLVEKFVDSRNLPTFEKIFNRGAFGELQSEIPPVSGPAWASFATGRNPGKHNIYDFVVREENAYSDRPINSNERRALSFWDMLGQQGQEVGVINVPGTYPAHNVNGFMISGMLSPGKDSDYTYPDDLKHQIRDQYRITHEKLYSPGREDAYLEELFDVARAQHQTALDLMARENPDVMTVVFSFTDSLHHFFWGSYEEETSPYHSVIPEGYERADRMVRTLMDEAGDDVNVIIVSDHGGGRLDGMVQLNLWLHQHGYLEFKNSPGTLFRRALFKLGWTAENIYRLMSSLKLQDLAAKQSRESRDKILRRLFLSWNDIDWNNTRAYSRGHIGQIFLNRKGREPNGIVADSEANALRDEIRSKLLDWEHPDGNRQFVTDVHTPEETYVGDNLDDAPELVVFFDGLKYIDYPGVLGANNLVGPHIKNYTGGHRMNGTLAALGPAFRNNTSLKANIRDLAPTLLYLSEAPIPEDMDGRILVEMLTEQFKQTNEPEYCSPDFYRQSTGHQTDVSESDQDEVRERLRNMGYLG